eukprot:scaffold273607_cov28-Tisochrysis_lutea.AAC.1
MLKAQLPAYLYLAASRRARMLPSIWPTLTNSRMGFSHSGVAIPRFFRGQCQCFCFLLLMAWVVSSTVTVMRPSSFRAIAEG